MYEDSNFFDILFTTILFPPMRDTISVASSWTEDG